MAWDIRRTYYYLVCFATLLMLIIGAVQVVNNVVDLALPAEPYRPSMVEMAERHRQAPGGEPLYSREELQQMADEEAERMRRDQRRNNIRNLIGSLALIGIAAPVYLYHWRQVRRAEG